MSWTQLQDFDARVGQAEVEGVRLALWSRYREHRARDETRLQNHHDGRVEIDAARMRFTLQRIGEDSGAPWPLFIVLHGGGGGPSSVNDAQWAHMQSYYRDSLSHGLYVAPRGITDTWDLHFRPESYALLDRLIENMVLYENADPDRVYLLGFSAGGDGVWQLAPRLADHFAAVSMSAGHPNGVSTVRMYSLPLLLQVGQRDEAYDRNRAVARSCAEIRRRAETTGGYPLQCFVHVDKPHNFADNEPRGTPQPVLEDVATWLDGGEPRVVERDTNAVRWVSEHRRQPWPPLLWWDRRTVVPDAADDWLYWVSAPSDSGASASPIRITLRQARRRIEVRDAPPGFTIYLRDEMLPLDGPLDVDVDGHLCTVTPQRTVQVMLQTLRAHGELPRMFSASVELRREDDGGWTAAPSAVSVVARPCAPAADRARARAGT